MTTTEEEAEQRMRHFSLHEGPYWMLVLWALWLSFETDAWTVAIPVSVTILYIASVVLWLWYRRLLRRKS